MIHFFAVLRRCDKGHFVTLFGVFGIIFIALMALLFLGVNAAGLAGYGTAALLSYAVGQRRYPIAYDVRGMMRYVFLAVALYVAAEYLPVDQPWLALAYKTFLLALYALYVYQREFSRRPKAA